MSVASNALYDALTAEAYKRGVCVKIVQRWYAPRTTEYCGKPREDGAIYCWRHRYGV